MVTNRKMPPKSPKIAFNETVKVSKVLHINEFTDEEVEASYYHKAEFKAVKAELKETVKMVESGLLPKDTPKFTRRGTEFRTPDGARSRLRNKQIAWNAVFEEQEAQWDEGVFDPEVLASIYEAAAKHCQYTAHNLALQDQIAAWNESTGSIAGLEYDVDEKPWDQLEVNGICLPLSSKQVKHRRISNAAA